MIVMGIDPGLATLGWGVVESQNARQRLIDFGCIITKPSESFPNRLKAILVETRALLSAYHPDEIAFEELFFSKNITTGISVASARGVCLSACAEYTSELFEYTPNEVKQAIAGYGKAEKKQIQQMVKLILHLDEIPKPDDAADAVAIALTHAATGPAKEQFRMK